MSSFELKPQSPIGLTTKAEDIVWTLPRSSVPPLLRGRVPEQIWTKTWDAVYTNYEDLLKRARPLKRFSILPCCVPCVAPKMIHLQRQNREDWMKLISDQQQAYTKYGIQLTLTQDVKTYESGHFEPLGLNFNIKAINLGPCKPTQTTHILGTIQIHRYIPYGKEEDAVTKLEKLERLHKRGDLSDEEFRISKSKITG